MKQYQIEINSKIGKLLIPEKKNRFNRDHIFYDILNIVKQNATIEQKLEVLYVFSEIEKVLKSLKQHEASVDELYQDIQNLYSSLDEKLKHYLSLSYYPMEALYFYEKNNYQKAIECLNVFFQNVNSILGKTPNLLNLASGEQYLNLIRVFKMSNDNINYIKSVVNLMKVCYCNEVEKDTNKTVETSCKFNVLARLEKIELQQWKIYLTDNIFKKYINNQNDVVLNEITSLVQNSLQIYKKENNFFFTSIRCLNYYLNGNYIESLKYFSKSLDYFEDKSDALFYINVHNMNKIFSSHSLKNEFFMKKSNHIISKIMIDFDSQFILKLLN